MALKNFIFTVLSIANLIILPDVLEARSYNGINDDFYKTYHINNYYDKNNFDDHEESPAKVAKKFAEYVAKENIDDNEKVNLRSRFIFPDELQTRHSDNRGSMIPAVNCGAQTFCESVSNYPQNFMDELLLNNSTLKHFVTDDVMPIETRAYTEEDPLCVTVERLIRPQSARNMRNETLFIIQSEASKFFQTVRIETCLEENTECKLIDVPLGYAMTCKQKYIYRELSALSTTGEPIRDYFKLPASCCCHSKFDPQIIQLRSSFRQNNNMK